MRRGLSICKSPRCKDRWHNTNKGMRIKRTMTPAMYGHSRQGINVGEKNGRARLTADEVIEIRNDKYITNIEYARDLRVSPQCVDAARRRVSWRHL